MEVLDTKTANQVASGAPGTIEIGGETYFVAQPTEADFVTLHKYLIEAWRGDKSKFLKQVAEQVKGLPEKLQEVAIRSAVEAQARGDTEPAQEALQSMLYELRHTAFWVWTLCRKNHPDLTLQAVASGVNADNQTELLAGLLRASSMAAVAPNSAGATGSA